ncbi:hypothetical protein FRC06_000328 [Ceratobasidium sp. 370]|nr:hypothetical protein FRC06_000328 [Ceratobasidium sp. 370]
MPQTTTSGPPSIPPPPSFNDFSFMSIGPRRSLLHRLNMAPQPGSPAGESANPPIVAFPPAPIDTSTISLVSENSIPSLGTSDTVNSSLLGPATPPLIPGGAPAFGRSDMSPTRVTGHTAPPCPVSALDMEVERADPDIVELPRPPPPRIPDPYRSLPADHYLVAPPAILPYPRSPPLQIDENHPLYTPASLFAHLPRAPPLSPRLDPLAILELETTREQSEWEQVYQGLERPSLSTLVAEDSFSAHHEHSRSVPQSPLAVQTNIEHSTSSPASAPASAVDPDSDVDSSDVELHVYDHVSPVTSTLASLDQDTTNSQIPPARSASQSHPSLVSISGPSHSAAPNPRVQHSQPTGLFAAVPRRTESAFGKGGAGPASSTITNGETTDSPEPTNTTPAKRKHDAMVGSARGTTQPSASGSTRVGVPPPLRASVDRTRVPTPACVPEGASASIDSAAPPTIPVPSPAPMQAATSRSLLPSTSTPAPDTVPQPVRKPCRFYNRPPGRVCMRKEQCPDLHEGPLQRPLSASVLATSTIPAFPSPFGSVGSPGVASAEPPASDTAVPSATVHEASAISRPQVTASPRPLTPPAPINSTPESSAAPTPSRPIAPPTASALSKRIASAGLPPRPLSSVDRPATPACRFFNTPKGCGRGRECPFRHEQRPNARLSRTQSGDSGAGTSGPPPTSVPQPTAVPSQGEKTQPPATSASSYASPKATKLVAGTSTARRNKNVPGARGDTVVVKTERESPAPKSSAKASVSRPNSPAGPRPMSREVKEEEVTLHDLGDGLASALDREMVDGTATDTRGTTPNNAVILPASLSSAPISEPLSTPNRIPPETTPQPGLTRPPAAVREQVSTNTEVGSVPPAPTSVPPPPVLSTVVVPPTPVHPPATDKGVAQPSGAPVRPPSRDSRRLDPHDRRELVTRIQDAPGRRTSRYTRSGSDAYRPPYNPRRSPSRSPSPPRSRGRSPIGSRGYSPPRGRGYSPPRSRGHSPLRSRSRSFSPPRWRNGGPPRFVRSRGYSPRRSISPRFDSRHARPARRRSSSSRSRSPERYAWRRSPSSPPRDARIPVRRASPPRGEDRWSSSHSPRTSSPQSPTIYRLPSSNARGSEYRPMADSWVAPPNRSPFVEDRGYSNGVTHYPPEAHTPRTWETNDRRSPLPLEATSYEHNITSDRETRDTQPADPTYPSHPSEHPQDSGYYPSQRSGFSAEMPLASSTPSRPPASESNVDAGPAKKPIVMAANYDNFEQSVVMEAPSPEVRNPTQARLQDRVDQYPGFVPASFVPVEASGPSLYARLTQDREQLPLAERLASSESLQSSRGAYGKGAKPVASSNNGQLAARLGVNAGERSQPLANRFVDEPRHRPNYQNRDREPPARPGGGLMARMVGDKKLGE